MLLRISLAMSFDDHLGDLRILAIEEGLGLLLGAEPVEQVQALDRQRGPPDAGNVGLMVTISPVSIFCRSSLPLWMYPIHSSIGCHGLKVLRRCT